jgi:sugar phosphate isomerase/epimerase
MGAPIFARTDDPGAWAEAVRAAGYRAAYCPVDESADDHTVSAYAEAARRADIVIAEVGAWSNPLDPDEKRRSAAIALCRARLALAERLGARCCVNIAGSRGEKWDGPCALDLTEESFEMVVETTRRIIDAVKPRRTFYTLEPMPWMYPDSPDSYLRLLAAVDRPACAVHLDPVNMICTPRRYFRNGAFLGECFDKLGPRIRSVHAKDIAIRAGFTLHLEEVAPGKGELDYRAFLRGVAGLDPDMPLMLEHLEREEEYREAADYVRHVAGELAIEF